MTLEQLRIFVGVAEREHMTKAAAALNVTQSTASAAVASLEGQFGVQLFHRIGRRIELTDAGHAFLEEARAVLGRASGAEHVLADFNQLKRGTLRLVVSQTIAGYWLPRHLAAFRAKHGQIVLDVAIANTEHAAQSVLAGTAELGFAEGAISDPALEHWPVAQDQLMLVGLAAPAQTDEQWVRSAHWVMRERGSGTRSTFEETLRSRGIDPERLNIALTLPSNESVLTAVEAGAGVAVLSALVVDRAIRTGTLRHIPFELPARPFFGLRHKERYQSKAARAMLQCIKEGTS